MKTVLIIILVLVFSLAFVKTQDDDKSPNDTSSAGQSEKAVTTPSKNSKKEVTTPAKNKNSKKAVTVKKSDTKAPSSGGEEKSEGGSVQDSSAKQKEIVDKIKQKYIRPDLENAQIGSRKYGDIYSEELMKALSKMNSKDLDKLTKSLGRK